MALEDLNEFGIVRMDDEDIGSFLSSQSVGILALPTDGAPTMRPMTYGFDGRDTLYLLYVVGSASRKAELTDRTETARFLVYSVETAFNCRSVLLTGRVSEVPEDERGDARGRRQGTRRPDLFERAGESIETALYGFETTERVGVEHVGRPPGFDRTT